MKKRMNKALMKRKKRKKVRKVFVNHDVLGIFSPLKREKN